METVKRKSFQGVSNIVRFNWHYYVIAIGLISVVLFCRRFLVFPFDTIVLIFAFAALLGMLTSLFVSWFIYDHSDLYELSFLDDLKISSSAKLININAGFDETSAILRAKFPDASLEVFDFYDPQKHTEISIERARNTYPAFPGTKMINTNSVPVTENSTDFIFLILAAHEIRNDDERADFFRQLKNGLKPDGRIIVVEHQRDFSNFFAFNFGFFHFHSNASWKKTFASSGLEIESESKHTAYLSIFTLRKNGTAS